MKNFTTRESDFYKKLSEPARWLVEQELSKGEEMSLTAAIDAVLRKVAERRVSKGKYEGERPEWAEPVYIFSPLD